MHGDNIHDEIVDIAYIFIHGNKIHDEFVGSQTVTHIRDKVRFIYL